MPSFDSGSITVRIRVSTWRFKLLLMTHHILSCLTTDAFTRPLVIRLEKFLYPLIKVKVDPRMTTWTYTGDGSTSQPLIKVKVD